MKSIILFSLILICSFAKGAVDHVPTLPRSVEIADIVKANLNLEVRGLNCILGIKSGEKGVTNVGIMTALGLANFQFPPASAEEKWSVEANDQLLFTYGPTFYVRFSFDSKLKFVSAIVHAEGVSTQGIETVTCDLKDFN